MIHVIENSKSSLVDNYDRLNSVYSDEGMTPQRKGILIRNVLKDCSNTEWTLYEETLIKIEVMFRTQVLMGELDKIPPLTKRVVKMKELIEKSFSDNEELASILINSVPHDRIINDWVNKPKWKQEVDKRMRDETLFAPENRHQMIQAIYREGLGGSAKHAEMYLKMSGDLGRPAEKDPLEKTFERVQNALNKK